MLCHYLASWWQAQNTHCSQLTVGFRLGLQPETLHRTGYRFTKLLLAKPKCSNNKAIIALLAIRSIYFMMINNFTLKAILIVFKTQCCFLHKLSWWSLCPEWDSFLSWRLFVHGEIMNASYILTFWMTLL